MRILVVEDEPKVASIIKSGLQENQYEVDVVHDGRTASVTAFQNDYDLYIIDIIIPFVNGIDLCRLIRQQRPEKPVLILTALGTTDDKLQGFDAGANDYLVKPFEFRELLARVKVLIKSSSMRYGSTNKIVIADLELDLDKKTARRGEVVVGLTSREFSLLEYFMRNPGRVLSRNDIAGKVWDTSFDFGTNVVDVYVNFLRKKIDKGFEKKLIHTRIGLGYIFREE
ncbi:MAG: response regulator transcription factor [Bacteroidales bacterium]|jgi:DNA-binding response OmpR family regulator|nr:response regulator transcription factor [Bacteroidales bacterium]